MKHNKKDLSQNSDQDRKEESLKFPTELENYLILPETDTLFNLYQNTPAFDVNSGETTTDQQDTEKQYTLTQNTTEYFEEKDDTIFPRYIQYTSTNDFDSNSSFIGQHNNQFTVNSASRPREEHDVFNELLGLANKNAHQPLYEIDQEVSHSSTEEKSALDRFYRAPRTKLISSKSNFTYQLKIVQQPSRARMCGFGDKDRRSVVPVPIIKLLIRNEKKEQIDPKCFDSTFLIVMCSLEAPPIETKNQLRLYQIESLSSEGSIRFPENYVNNLVGTTVASANKLYDLNGDMGIFFIFHDLSLRKDGLFRLKFSLVDVGSSLQLGAKKNPVSTVMDTVYSDTFTVYPVKKYPGVIEASPLSVCFVKQGMKISIRKEKGKSKRADKDSGNNQFF